ncbi:MAG: dTMP kinase [Ignavibacteria bacterium]|nr:dTMP kinase [Ignavibacteria bacterium]
MFISFEGIDFCGKSTQVRKLREYFESLGKKVIIIREPGGTPISEKIRDILLDKKNSGMMNETEILLFSASRAQLVREEILPQLKEGNIVISDRFFDSTTAYQGYGRGIDTHFVKTINAFAVGEAVPAVTFFLDLPIEEMIKRQSNQKNTLDRMELSTREFFENVRRGYLEIATTDKRFVVIDATKSVEDIHQIIISHIA